ncbi:MAG: hypothetical protein GY795_49695 [Desulfobacterales bacterium]|nr:hypothetical protein [Desulfobacterales bacterium]
MKQKQIKFSRKLLFLGIMCFTIILSLAEADAVDILDGITTVSPDSAQAGETVSVTLTLDSSANPPSGTPDSAWLGSIEGTGISRSDDNVTASFTIPNDQACGKLDAKVVFKTTVDDTTSESNYIKTDGFTINKGITSDIIYVNAGSSASNPDGTSWEKAFKSLQDALDAAECYSATQIWVVKGTYYPTSGTDRTISFRLVSGVSLYGGFAGTETDVSERDYQSNSTILSGDIGTSDDSGDNSYHAVIGADDAILDGFTVSGGYADGHSDADSDESVRWHRMGGGMYNDNTSPTITNCTFSNNYADSGGAMYNYEASPSISDSAFNSNSANYGGGILFRKLTTTTVSNCTFKENTAQWRGGAIYIDYGAGPIISDCEFSSNTSNGNGGAIYADDRFSATGGTYPSISSSSFTGNTASYRGGAIAIYNYDTILAVSDTTFTENSVTDTSTDGTGGGAVACNLGGALIVSNISYSDNDGGSGEANYDLTDYTGSETCTYTETEERKKKRRK